MRAVLDSIRGRLILLVLLLVLPAALLVYSTALHNRDLLHREARQRLLSTAQRANDDLQELIHDARSLHHNLNLVPDIRNRQAPECGRLLSEALALDRHFANLIATDRDGQGRCSALPVDGPLPNYADRDYFRKMQEKGGLVVGLPLKGRITGKYGLPIAGPLTGGGGEVLGALILAADLAPFGDRFVSKRLDPGLVFHLWDSNGKILFRHPDAEQLTGQSFLDLALVRRAAEMGGIGIVETKGFDGIDRVVGFSAPSGEYAETGIYIGVTMPAKNFYAAADATMARALWAILAIFLVGIVAAWLLGSRLIWRQIEKISGAARRLAAGQSSARIGTPYPAGELGELARTFDEMAETSERHLEEINKMNAGLELRVLDRTEQLQASEQLFRSVLESAADAFLIVNADGRIVIVNAQAVALFGYSREEMHGLSVDALLPEGVSATHRAHREQYAVAPAQRKMSGRKGLQGRRKDGSIFFVSVSLSPLVTPQERFITAVVRDITQQIADEAALESANRTLRMLSVCNEALVRAHDEADLLEAICRHIVELGGYRLAWVGFVLHDEAQSVQPAAQCGESGYVEQLHITWADTERGRGPVGRSVRESVPVVVQDIQRDAAFLPWLSAADEHGFVAMIALPLKGRQEVFGTLAIYSAEHGVFNDEEVRLLAELADDLAYGISSLREAVARQRVEHELNYRASYDSLTGLPNRAVFIDRAEQALVHAHRNGRQVALLLLDLDRFKAINDNFGRQAGDQLLNEIARRLQASLREGDTVARLSVDEFGILISDMAHTDDALPLAQKLVQAVALPVPFAVDDTTELFVTGSLGISLFPRDGDNPEHLLKAADAAMHSAKSLGGNVFHFYAEEMNRRLSTRIVLEGALRRALENGELQLHYQPKVSLVSGEVVGAEALVRWPHPDRGMISPLDFIPLAEETGLIVPLGKWVLNTACAQMRQWIDEQLSVPPIAVNLSARQFLQPDLIEVIRSALEVHQLAPHLLEVEITESTAMVNIDRAVSTLHALKALGVLISLDDFGTGYSSLSYLKRFPVNHLKIDRAFVRDITTDPDDALICKAVIGLAHNLKMSVIAEGVETEGQMNYLRQHHCDEMQGYHFSRPLPAEGFAALLGKGTRLSFVEDGGHTQGTLLLVDDEESILSALKRVLRRSGYRILTAGSAAEGFELLATHDVQVIICDQRMPAMSGTAFLRRVKDLYPDTVRMVLSGYTELSSITEAINQGAIYKFLTKPWEDSDLQEKVQEAFRFYVEQKDKRT